MSFLRLVDKMNPMIASFWIVVVITVYGFDHEANAGLVCSQDQLVGDWKLCSAEDLVNGKWVRSFGDEPVGYFSFSSTGLASVQFMKAPSIANGDNESNSYLAYFGKYSVNEHRCEFTVDIEGSLKTSLVGTKAVRPFSVENASILKIGDGVTFRRRFVRRGHECSIESHAERL